GEADPECLENGLYPENGINRTGRWMIAGHYPVANFDPGELLPYVNKEAQIVDIDGGINTLPLEQLNALICTPDGFSYTFEDHYEARVILSDYRPVPLDAPAFHQKWPDIYVDVIRPGESFSFCRSRMGREGYIKNEKLVRDDQGLRFTGCALAKLLPVRAGEVVKLLDDSADDYWCVRNTSGLMGYVPRSIVGEAVTPEGPFAEITPLNI
ncbi:MAG: hypothetical protein IJR36_00440, partial [Lachnospiraceae bacterium]|nr:hypothetical protein [Lachnospiraceae bacterium]